MLHIRMLDLKNFKKTVMANMKIIYFFFIILQFNLLNAAIQPQINLPISDPFYERVLLTISCKDCDSIPKVENAGQIITVNNIDYQIMHNGTKIITDCYYGKWMTEIIRLLKGHHEPQEEKVFFEVLQVIPENATMIELGCYWAYYSMWFQTVIPNATNYMIEPGIEELTTGMKNFVANNLHGHFFRGALGSYGPFESAPLINDFEDLKAVQTAQVQMDQFIAEHNIPFIHILHSDIQGAEYQMLEGCNKSIKNKKIGFFFISTHSEELHQKCLNYLKNFNYIIVADHTPAQSFSVDGLIVASAQYYPQLASIQISKK